MCVKTVIKQDGITAFRYESYLDCCGFKVDY